MVSRKLFDSLENFQQTAASVEEFRSVLITSDGILCEVTATNTSESRIVAEQQGPQNQNHDELNCTSEGWKC